MLAKIALPSKILYMKKNLLKGSAGFADAEKLSCQGQLDLTLRLNLLPFGMAESDS
jgi:hypothetical protein